MERILLATDGSESAAAAARFLAALPLPPGTSIHVVTVVDGLIENLLEHVQQGQRDHARQIVEEAGAILRKDGITVTGAVRTGQPAHEIIRAAEELDADLVVVGSQGRTGLEGLLLGSVARNVAKHARRPVLVARASTGLRHIVLATDGSPPASEAAAYLAGVPLPDGTGVTVVNVQHTIPPYFGLAGMEDPTALAAIAAWEAQSQETATEWVEAARASLAREGRHVDIELRKGDPGTEILAVAEERQADLIVAGARGGSLIEDLFVGSVAERLLRFAHCSVLLVTGEPRS